jgi:hypothetical protein
MTGAYGEGRRNGTILVDEEGRHPIKLLQDRTAATLARWLETHPGVEVLARDRSTGYAEGATRGAPQAVQVADRFHLIDLGDAVERVLDRYRPVLRELTLPPLDATPPAQTADGEDPGSGSRGSRRGQRQLRQ